MKKAVVVMLMLVLGVASYANATLIDLRFSDGSYEKTLQPSEYTDIDLLIFLEDTDTIVASSVKWLVVEDPAEPPDFTITEYFTPLMMVMATPPGDSSGFPWTSNNMDFAGIHPGGGWIVVERFYIHCAAPSEDIISVDKANSFISPTTTEDYVLEWDPAGGGGSVTLHQIPEPASLALLALGGLALIRRR
jgi:hypothetical protein